VTLAVPREEEVSLVVAATVELRLEEAVVVGDRFMSPTFVPNLSSFCLTYPQDFDVDLTV
jgi:hypothetical protein